MIKIVKKNLKSLKEDWDRLMSENPYLNPVQSWDMTNLISKSYSPYFISGRGETPCFYSFVEDGKTIAIAPLSHSFFSNTYHTLGKSLSIPERQFIYSADITIEKLKACIILLLEELNDVTLLDIPADSKMHEALVEMGYSWYVEFPYVSIPMLDYDTWFNGLSKHVKQNIRTAYNKLNKQSIDVDFQVFSKRGGDTPFMNIYLQRRDDHEDHDSLFHKFWIKNFHFYTLALKNLESSLLGVLKMNGKVVSYWGGFVSQNRDFVTIPRLAIDSNMKEWSPGIILICETAKVLNSRYGIKNFDLSRGNHGYKKKMGGEEYYSHSFHLVK